jgi:uncharacterized membrane protein YbhN (UPF0104 family)
MIIAKLVIIISAFYVISGKIIQNDDFHTSFNLHFQQISFFKFIFILFSVLLFTLFNWIFEILKWKNLASVIQSVRFYEAFKQSTSSLTASLITPNRIGEYGAKAVYYLKKDQKKIMALNLLGNTTQMFITILFGIPGLFYLGETIGFHLQLNIIVVFLFVSVIIFLFLKQQNIYKRFFGFIKEIPFQIQTRNLLYSFLRYLIFSHQFYFLLMVFGVDLDYLTAMSLIFSTYIISSVIPGFVLFDFIIKGSVAVSLFGLFETNEIVILTVTSLMWILNFAVPAIIGSYFVLTFNFPVSEKISIRVK